MPRKKAPEGAADAEQLKRARWRFLLRNPEFRAEFNELGEAWKDPRRFAGTAKPPSLLRDQFQKKWGLFLPSELYYSSTLPDLTPATLAHYETFLASDAAWAILSGPVENVTEKWEDGEKVCMLSATPTRAC